MKRRDVKQGMDISQTYLPGLACEITDFFTILTLAVAARLNGTALRPFGILLD